VVFVVIIVATGAFVFKEVAKSINESTDPAKNSQTGLADGDYQMTPTSATGLNDKCGFEGPAVAAATGETSSGNVLVVGQGVTDCSTSVSVDFTVTGGVATITSISSGGTQTGQAAAPTQDSPTGETSPGDVAAGPAITDPAFLAYEKSKCKDMDWMNPPFTQWDDAGNKCLAVASQFSSGSADFTGAPGDVIPQSFFLTMLRDRMGQGFTCPDGSPITTPSQECLIAAAKDFS